ncbi:methyltransferase domain-containing protein [Stackebrandtia nassauensis]|uniref:Methyltransferase type 11 n=1 Tax=Stackebrandtia nassauensis (strain DSM 44728 / CIP 108903 / NRRL B-16338 / NBRC 102104 / LLR-40K-21) TaxID=446470 RepID=D3Q9M1_STANL|nr:methyltransferase domain-containing protein [Stackebrandtia nassauensis]ADD44567.1 Methyltransferase type 11 [Stackebrandtia nassauensis DSM 44728]
MDALKAVPSSRLAVVWSVVTGELARPMDCDTVEGPCRVVDVGGGTGGFAVPLAQAGYEVTVVDPSPNALAGLTRRAADAGVAERVTAVQGDTDALTGLVEPGSVRLVLCHSVLEMVDSPQLSMDAIASVLAPGGAASILGANRVGAVLSRALIGNLSAAMALLNDPDGRVGERDTLCRRFDPEELVTLVASGGLTVEQRHGVQVLADMTPGGRDTEPGAAQALREFEAATAALAPYRDIATHIHVLARKPVG